MITLVPQTSVSLETRDGNIFVWQMDEVDRMTSEEAPVVAPVVAPIARDLTAIPMSDLDVDSAADLLRTVHDELGRGYGQLRNGRRISTWGSVITNIGYTVGLVNAVAEDPSSSANNMSWAIWGLGVGISWYGSSQQGSGTKQIGAAYDRLNAAMLGKGFPEPSKEVPKRQYGESRGAYNRRLQKLEGQAEATP